MRKLASVQKIKEVLPIEGADRIELVKILGWQCVAKKGEFRPGDNCIYFEIDSFLPIDERFEFLRASSYKNSELLGEGFRLKTQKMRGEISQGLCLPVSIVEEMGWIGLPEGTDVTELLGVRKWEVPERATTGGTIVGNLPDFIPKTDETRIQNIPDILKEFGDCDYYISTKMDGSSHSIGMDENGEFFVTGHNYQYKDDGMSSFYEFVKKKGFKDALKVYKENHGIRTIAVQGEYCGPGLQKNRLKLMEPDWYVFNVEIDGKRQPLKTLLEVALKIHANTVPMEEYGMKIRDSYPDEEALLERAKGSYPNGGPKEGIVIRPMEPVMSETIHDYLSFKVINNDFLLKQKD